VADKKNGGEQQKEIKEQVKDSLDRSAEIHRAVQELLDFYRKKREPTSDRP